MKVITKINKNVKALRQMSDKLCTPIQFLERQTGKDSEYRNLMNDTQTLIGMFSDKYNNFPTIFKNVEIHELMKNSGGNFSYDIIVGGYKVDIDDCKTLMNLSLKTGGLIEFVQSE
jgi:hypothetical protein